MATQPIIVLCTAPSQDEASAIGRALVEARLAACVTLASGVESYYRWQGAVERATETLMLIKTTRERFEDVRRAIVEGHSYDVPEVIAVPVVAGHQPYLDWLHDSVRGGEGPS